MNKNLLKLKNISSTDKLVLMLMMDYPKILLPINLRASDMAKDLGTTRKMILESMDNLVVVGYITTELESESSSRKSVLTPEFLEMIKVVR